MKIATWNVNSIRVRERRLMEWLEAHRPDVLCLQELKVEEPELPTLSLRSLGYHVVANAQKTYNGVAILSLAEPDEVRLGMGDGVDDPQARLVSARVGGVWVISAYFPNGGKLGSDKYAYKLEWMRRLRATLDARFSASDEVALCGDFNVAPSAIDVSEVGDWSSSVLTSDEVRDALESIRAFGFVDTFRAKHPDVRAFSWWDYRMLSFPKNDGLRIDHVFATEPLAARCVDVVIDREERKKKPWDAKGKSSASDHVPVIATFG